MNVVFVNIDRCIACLSCVRVCSFEQGTTCRDVDANIFVHVDWDHRRIFTATCHQCQAPVCMRVCPVGAITRDPKSKAVVVNRKICIGCGMCVTACPFGSVHLDEVRRVAAKCDLCGGHPKCVQVCMAKALHFGSINELAELKRKKRDSKLFVRAIPIREEPEE